MSSPKPLLQPRLLQGLWWLFYQGLQYGTQQECWAHIAHHSLPAETISLEISAVFEAGGKKRNVHSNNIGMSVEVTFFWWRENEFIVHDTKWVDLMQCPGTQPYFYANCLSASNRKNSKGLAFKTKQFGLFVIVPEAQWEEFEAFRDKPDPPSPASVPT
ncbi:hypothetical protein EDC04DRAFT_2607174 [Pisolithus marmoratus]|nr:hypothetical protein EDC04DRAFT_2607174 [Pisolithus marmoratus]